MDAIRCENLSKHFGKLVALDDLSLTIETGAIFGFLGPNGAGKTTTLRLLAGIIHPTDGRVWVAGQEISRNALKLRSLIGYLPESPAFYGWMTGREFLLFIGGLYGLDGVTCRARTEELLEKINLAEAADRRVKTYSRGMQQRLGLAQSLMNRPQVLLLDEPASALDPMGRRDMLETIHALKGETTVFISTHILADVERICDRVAIINYGKLVAMGAIDELRSQRGKSLFEIQFEEDADSTSARLENVPWVRSTRVLQRDQRSVLQVDVADLDTAKRELPRLLLDSGLTLLRYELTSASLEEVFLELVASEEEVS
ncbi:MAG: ABC transporter ATP-binding protein [Dehalococcoidia bacterium]